VNCFSSVRVNPSGTSLFPTPKPFYEKAAMAFGVGVPFFSLFLGIYLCWGRGLKLVDLILMVGLYSLTILGITVGFHRMFTHRAYESGPVLRGILAIFGSMAGQGPVIEWCALHRRHHQHSDRDGDPHSPHLHGEGVMGMLSGMWHAHFGWLFAPEPPELARSVKDLIDDPILNFVDRFFWVWFLLGWIIPGAIGGLIGHSWWSVFTGVLWGGLIRTSLLHHVTWSINSVCHIWGTRPYESPDESRNNPIFGLLAFGEGWHNNHHAFPSSARHGLRWWQVDLSWWTIQLLEKAGLVWNLRLPGVNAMELKLRKAA
jgi:stearoyl-CoA desaturase (delta-9 desaturase)